MENNLTEKDIENLNKWAEMYGIEGLKIDNKDDLPIITDENEKEYWGEFKKTSSPQIKLALINRYAHLVKYTADRFKQSIGEICFRMMDYDDFVCLGYFGLSIAIDRYVPNKDIKFKIYAIIIIQGEIYDEIRKMDGFPKRIRREMRTANNVREILDIKLERSATPKEIAEEVGMDIEDYHYIMSYILTLPETSLYEISRYIDDKRNLKYWFENKEVEEEIISALKKLPQKEHEVLKLYYYEALTLKEIGKIFELSEVKVVQILGKAIQDLIQIMNK